MQIFYHCIFLSNRAILPTICVSVSHILLPRGTLYVLTTDYLLLRLVSLSFSTLFMYLCLSLFLYLCLSFSLCFHFTSFWFLHGARNEGLNTFLKRFSAMMLLWLMHAGHCNGNEISITGNFRQVSFHTTYYWFWFCLQLLRDHNPPKRSLFKKCSFLFYCTAVFTLCHFVLIRHTAFHIFLSFVVSYFL